MRNEFPRKTRLPLACFVSVAVSILSDARAQGADVIQQPFDLGTGLVSRSISFENPTGAPGEGGRKANNLGIGRKGSACRIIKPGETVELCDIKGPGTIRHIWMTLNQYPSPMDYRSYILRAWWDGQVHPSIECPIGDFFGMSHGKITPYQSAVHSVSQNGLNIWLPMPFPGEARFTFTNEGPMATYLFYQIDYTLGDKHPDDVGRLHVLFTRENPTTEKRDFELLPARHQKGRYLGSVIGIRNLHPAEWWGEGEIKFYMDGDSEFPTIVGTGSEDLAGQGWGDQEEPYLYNGCTLNYQNTFITIYRWYLPDPKAWEKEARITIQQIEGTKDGYKETADDWSAATFWYEPVPSAPLPPMPDEKARTADLWQEAAKK
jgi:Protein of unknown function (DUF2961)